MIVYCILYVIAYSLSICTSIYFPSENIVLARESLRLYTTAIRDSQEKESTICLQSLAKRLHKHIIKENDTLIFLSLTMCQQSNKINMICNICYFAKEESCVNGSRFQNLHYFSLPPHLHILLYWPALEDNFFFSSEWKRTDWAYILARTHQHSSMRVLNRFEMSPNIWPNYFFS